MKFYVAGASAEWKRAYAVMTALREMGHEITFDWTVPFSEGRSNGDLTRNLAERYAALDAHGVSSSQILVVLVPSEQVSTTGAWTELGLSLGLRGCAQGTVISLPDPQMEWWKKNIFLTLAARVFPSDEALLEYAYTVLAKL